MTWGVMDKLFFSPLFFLFVVPCVTYLNYDEDVDTLVEVCFIFYLIGIDCVFIIYYYFCFKRYIFNSCLKFIYGI